MKISVFSILLIFSFTLKGQDAPNFTVTDVNGVTHHLYEDYLDQGKVVAYGTHAELIRMVGEQTRLDLSLNTRSEKIIPTWEKVEGVSKLSGSNGTVTALVDDSNRVMPRLFDSAMRIMQNSLKEHRIRKPDIRAGRIQLNSPHQFSFSGSRISCHCRNAERRVHFGERIIQFNRFCRSSHSLWNRY